MGIKKMKWNDVTMVSTVKEMLNLAVEEAGDSLAFQYKDETNKDNIISVTYKEFKKDTEELGTALASIDMHDKHIAVIGENSYNWIITYFATVILKI